MNEKTTKKKYSEPTMKIKDLSVKSLMIQASLEIGGGDGGGVGAKEYIQFYDFDDEDFEDEDFDD